MSQLVEDAHPAEDEEQVVRGDRSAAEREQDQVGVAEIVGGVVERAAQRPADESEEDEEQHELPRDHPPRVFGGEAAERAQTSGHSLMVAYTVSAGQISADRWLTSQSQVSR